MDRRGDEKSEHDVDDVDDDENVAGSRAGKRGSYVGQTASDDSIDAEETGAEAREEQENR
jgi:hypothetical protein